MNKHCFSFLENSFAVINNEAMAAEKHLVNENYTDSIFRIGKAAEFITISICEFEGMDWLIPKGQKKMLEQLAYKGKITNDIFKKFEDIRNLRNTVAHSYSREFKDKAYDLHKKFFDIAVFFYQKYKDKTFEPEEYNGPIMKKDKVDGGSGDEKSPSPKDGPLSDYPFEKYDGSYLLNELVKLKDSSREAVEDDNLSDFKKYLHVDRSIQDDFIKEIKKVNDLPSSHLIMLCGSVGDGKSHLLAYTKKENPELLENFTIHNDATESFDPEKNAIDTLATVLKPFNDSNIDISSDKFILAINLGVLNNFLESDYAKEEFTKLKKIIESANIFDSTNISKNISKDKVSFITFSDYNMFELTGDANNNYVSSKYISSLFEKVTLNEDFNPFYIAYLKDKESNYFNPLISNYEMLMSEDVQKTIIDYIIKIFIKYRRIISTRDLLNFIYEIIVPPEILKEEDMKKVDLLMNYSLPNLLFNSSDRSDLLKLFSQLDPTLIRNEELDRFIIDLNINEDIKRTLNYYFDLEKMDLFKDYLDYIEDFNTFKVNKKRESTAVLIRLAVFYGKSIIKNNFRDEVYLNFLKYLYSYNVQSHKDYKDLFSEIKDAIYKWKGSFKKNTICIDTLDSFKVFKNLKLKPHPDNFDNQLLEGLFLGNRFKTEIKIYFSVDTSNKKIPLDVDFSLYEYIRKLYKGFKPNQTDKDDLIIFDEFISNLLAENPDQDLYVLSLEDGKEFLFEYNDFGSFEFRES